MHVAGEKTFVDYAGLTMPVHDVATDTVREAQIFVGALGASHLIFAEPTWTQTLPDWIGSHVHMVEYFDGVTALIVPDNLKSGVTSPCYYEPTVHATYQDFATHYGTAILPARAIRAIRRRSRRRCRSSSARSWRRCGMMSFTRSQN